MPRLLENAADDRTLTHFLYGGDMPYRLAQEIVLGIGGVQMLRALGHEQIDRFHLNEGHSALLVMELLGGAASRVGALNGEHRRRETVRRLCVFTTHTPVPAAHDQFPMELAGGSSVLDRWMRSSLCAATGAR